jgi:hypothetical protein
MPTNEELGLLAIIGVGATALFILADEEEDTAEANKEKSLPATGDKKETYFLRFNQDGVYGNLLATEEHFRKIGTNKDFNQCAVKHLALGANHADEAVSHEIAVGDSSASKKYAELRDGMTELQHDVQDGKVSSTQGIERVRKLKSEFESFNPSFDVSKCKACQVL